MHVGCIAEGERPRARREDTQGDRLESTRSGDRARGRTLRRDWRHEARGRRHPGSRRRARQALLRQPGLEGRRRLRHGRRVSGRAIHASRLAVLDPLRHRRHDGRAGLGGGPLSHRVGHRGGARRARRPRCRREQGVSSRRAGKAASRRSASGARQLLSFATFSDPDGNEWLLQEVTARLPGRVDSNATSFASASDLASAMRRASVAHGEHETRMGGRRDEDWPAWYAEYIVAEQAGKPLPS
jgi:hypothetical protein